MSGNSNEILGWVNVLPRCSFWWLIQRIKQWLYVYHHKSRVKCQWAMLFLTGIRFGSCVFDVWPWLKRVRLNNLLVTSQFQLSNFLAILNAHCVDPEIIKQVFRQVSCFARFPVVVVITAFDLLLSLVVVTAFVLVAFYCCCCCCCCCFYCYNYGG